MALPARVSLRRSPGKPGPGHFQSFKLPEDRLADDRFQSTAAIGRRPLETAHSPKQSLTISRRWSAIDASRTSGARSADQALPTPTRHRRVRIACSEPGIRVLDRLAFIETGSRWAFPIAIDPIAETQLNCLKRATAQTKASQNKRTTRTVTPENTDHPPEAALNPLLTPRSRVTAGETE